MSTAGSLLIVVEIFVVEIDAMGQLVIVLRYSTGKDEALGLQGACVIILLLPNGLGDWRIQCGLRFLRGLW